MLKWFRKANPKSVTVDCYGYTVTVVVVEGQEDEFVYRNGIFFMSPKAFANRLQFYKPMMAIYACAEKNSVKLTQEDVDKLMATWPSEAWENMEWERICKMSGK